MRRVCILIAFVALGVVLSAAQPATDFCAGPEVGYEAGTVVRASTLTIAGVNFGDACNDTAALPAGVSDLGEPLTGIEIFFVQGTDSFLVAAGSADAQYAFLAEVIVPSELEPGEARLSVRAPGFEGEIVDEDQPSLTVSDAEPPNLGTEAIFTFGPGVDPVVVTPAAPARTNDDATAVPAGAQLIESGDDNNTLLLLGLAAVTLFAGALVAMWAWGRARNTPSTETPDPVDPDDEPSEH